MASEGASDRSAALPDQARPNCAVDMTHNEPSASGSGFSNALQEMINGLSPRKQIDLNRLPKNKRERLLCSIKQLMVGELMRPDAASAAVLARRMSGGDARPGTGASGRGAPPADDSPASRPASSASSSRPRAHGPTQPSPSVVNERRRARTLQRRSEARRTRLKARCCDDADIVHFDVPSRDEATSQLRSLYSTSMLKDGATHNTTFDLLTKSIEIYCRKQTWSDSHESLARELVQCSLLKSCGQLAAEHETEPRPAVEAQLLEHKLQVFLRLYSLPRGASADAAQLDEITRHLQFVAWTRSASEMNEFMEDDVMDWFVERIPERLAALFNEMGHQQLPVELQAFVAADSPPASPSPVARINRVRAEASNAASQSVAVAAAVVARERSKPKRERTKRNLFAETTAAEVKPADQSQTKNPTPDEPPTAVRLASAQLKSVATLKRKRSERRSPRGHASTAVTDKKAKPAAENTSAAAEKVKRPRRKLSPTIDGQSVDSAKRAARSKVGVNAAPAADASAATAGCSYAVADFAVRNYRQHMSLMRSPKARQSADDDGLFYARGSQRLNVFEAAATDGPTTRADSATSPAAPTKKTPKNRSGRKNALASEFSHVANYLLNTDNHDHLRAFVPKVIAQRLKVPYRLGRLLRRPPRARRRLIEKRRQRAATDSETAVAVVVDTPDAPVLPSEAARRCVSQLLLSPRGSSLNGLHAPAAESKRRRTLSAGEEDESPPKFTLERLSDAALAAIGYARSADGQVHQVTATKRNGLCCNGIDRE